MTRTDELSAEGIRALLKDASLRIECYPLVDSTNTVLKERAAAGAAEGLVVAAEEQTAGRGRMGRSFFSPAGPGLYLSVLLRPTFGAEQCGLLTPAAAVAAAEAIEALSGRETQIKWVNDVLLDGRKICGILTEASVNWESGLADYVIVGIGVNVRAPAGDFPEDIRDRAGAVFEAESGAGQRCALAAAILDRFMALYRSLGSEECYKSYANRSAVLGRDVWLLSPGREPEAATVLAIERDYALRVRLADGTERLVNSGEVSIRPRE